MNFLFFILWIFLLFGSALQDQRASHCRDGWVAGDTGFCYWISNARLSWPDANKECWKLDSTLLRIYSSQDLTSILSLVNQASTTRWWTDLNDYKTTGIWVWGRGSGTSQAQIDLIQWNKEPDDRSHLENCGALNFQGTVSDERCGDKYSYICEYSLPPGGQCQNGWFSYKSGCYHLVPVGDPWNLVTWSQANQTCTTILSGTPLANVKSHLLFIETPDELAYIRKMLPMVPLTSQLWWIGMTDLQTERQFIWTDGRTVQNSSLVWAIEPNDLGGKEKCTVIYGNGKFADLNCNRTESYICVKENDALPPSVLPNLGCPSRWIRAGHSCYLMETAKQLSWQDAKLTCILTGGLLLKVDSLDERMWLEEQSLGFESGTSYWTGLNNLHDKTSWRWADGSAANSSMIKWNSEPNNYMGREDCATVSQSGTFNDVPCLMKNAFICELQTEDSPCPTGWLTLFIGDQSNCYYISNTTATKDEARSACQQLSAPLESYLWAPNSQSELNFVIRHAQSLPQTDLSWFTGLTDSGHEGFWAFDTSFNTPPQAGFIPWSMMPHYVDGDERCAYFIYGGNYVNRKCTVKGGYICEKLAYGFVGASSSSRILSNSWNIFILILWAMVFL